MTATEVLMAGFGGQQFDRAAPDKLRRIRQLVSAETVLSVDGGLNRETIGPCAAAGANLFVTGTALFSRDDYGPFIGEMAGLAKSHQDARVS